MTETQIWSRKLVLTLCAEIFSTPLVYLLVLMFSGDGLPWEWDQEGWGFVYAIFILFVLPLLVVVMVGTIFLFWLYREWSLTCRRSEGSTKP